MEFPRLVYKGPAIHCLVENAEEHAQAIKAGWYDTVPETLGKKVEVTVKQAPKPEDLGQGVLPAHASTAPAPVVDIKKGKKSTPAPVASPVTAAPAMQAAPGKMPWD